jgi:DNA-binding winged helix-turn-helix (wHTH) protein
MMTMSKIVRLPDGGTVQPQIGLYRRDGIPRRMPRAQAKVLAYLAEHLDEVCGYEDVAAAAGSVASNPRTGTRGLVHGLRTSLASVNSHIRIISVSKTGYMMSSLAAQDCHFFGDLNDVVLQASRLRVLAKRYATSNREMHDRLIALASEVQALPPGGVAHGHAI